MNQAALFLPVNVLYTALQFLIKFYYFSKADELDQFYLFNSYGLVFTGVPTTIEH
jgi:hypothetical protein